MSAQNEQYLSLRDLLVSCTEATVFGRGYSVLNKNLILLKRETYMGYGFKRQG